MYVIAPDQALVLTVDCFMPIHDDPFTYGQIAAANSLSDVYAMGGRPMVATNVCGFPRDKLPLQIMSDIIKGGSAKAAEAGVPIAGGHTLDNPEPFYGMAVVGTVHPDKIVTNAGARPGDQLVLTKPLGTGIVMTAMMTDQATDHDVWQATQAMSALNKDAAEVMLRFGAHAATDITGFGLIGHGHELAQASGVTLRFWLDRLPILPGALEYAAQGILTGGGGSNLDYYKTWTDFGGHTDERIDLVCDAQTSGGLLISFPPETVEEAIEEMRTRGVQAVRVGEVLEGEAGRLEFR